VRLDPHLLVVIFGLLGALLILLVARELRKWNADKNNTFAFIDLFSENGRASKGAVVMLGAFAATTWFFVYYTLAEKMTEGYFGLYAAAWIAPVVARMVTNAPPAGEAKATTTTTTTATKTESAA
jgi:hypothetical protein